MEGCECKHGRRQKEIEEDENPWKSSNFRQENYLWSKESLDGGESLDFKKIKSFSLLFRTGLELKSMDQEILEYLDESKINEDVSCSCDFASAIQACIVDLETAF